MDKKEILDAKLRGDSNRKVARDLGIDRKTVAHYWNEYQQRLSKLSIPGADVRAIQDELYDTPKYKSSEKK